MYFYVLVLIVCDGVYQQIFFGFYIYFIFFQFYIYFRLLFFWILGGMWFAGYATYQQAHCQKNQIAKSIIIQKLDFHVKNQTIMTFFSSFISEVTIITLSEYLFNFQKSRLVLGEFTHMVETFFSLDFGIKFWKFYLKPSEATSAQNDL
eukprot:TRINITY_DN1264_c1_g1_i4.p1 TRINITY_DN1264_c1_g1~~TRINITY_DN1264_c1_g1_i4.p1  ORF type:complete len:149 (+),score=2.38 TRINITY_DN1264_c1_g1_i4:215-661(+)